MRCPQSRNAPRPLFPLAVAGFPVGQPLGRVGFLGKPQGTLAHDVLLDLVGAAGDRLARYRDEDLGDESVERAQLLVSGQHSGRSGDQGWVLVRLASNVAESQLDDRALRTG